MYVSFDKELGLYLMDERHQIFQRDKLQASQYGY